MDSGSEAFKRAVCDKVTERLLSLSCDQFGNYVLQHYLGKAQEDAIDNIGHKLLPIVRQLSFHKFGSNVLEKARKHATLMCV